MYEFYVIKSMIKDYIFFKENGIKIKHLFDKYTVSSAQFYRFLNKYKNDSRIFLPDNVHIIRENNYKSNNTKVTEDINSFIVTEITKNPIALSKEIKVKIYEIFGVTLTQNHISCILRKNNISYKKLQKQDKFVTTDKFDILRDKLKKEIVSKDADNIISIDEVGFNLTDTPKYGRSRKNTKCVVNETYAKTRVKYSAVIAIKRNTVIGCTLVKGSVNGKIFNNFIKYTVIPKMNIDDRCLIDNAKIHKNKELIEFFNNKHQNFFIYNIPYSPKFNPIEQYFNPIKKEVKHHILTTENDLIICLENKFKKLKNNTKQHENYFKRSFDHLFSNRKY
jgi:transposase